MMKTLAFLSTIFFLLCICLMLLGQFFEVKKSRLYKLFVIGFILSIAFMAYSTYYGEGSDIKRYYDMMSVLEGKTYSWARENGHYKNTSLTNFLFWSIAQTGNYKLLPMLAAAFTMLMILYIINCEQKRTNVSSCVIFMYVLQIFAVVTLSGILSGVRQTMAVSLFAVAVYRDFIEKKKNTLTIILYLLTCTLHVAMLFFLLIRICAFVKGKVKWIFLLWGLLIPFLEKYADSEGLFGEAIDKLFFYTEKQGDFDIRFTLARTGILVVVFYIFLKVKKGNSNNSYINFVETAIIFTIGAISIEHLYSRLMNLLIYISFPLLVAYYNTHAKNKWEMVQAVNTFLCLGLFAYQVVFAINYWQFI